MIRLRYMSGPQNGQVFRSAKAEITLGRSPEVDVSFADHPSTKISRNHARISFRNSWYEVLDERSRNGTFVNGDQVDGSRRLRCGDIIQLGRDTGPKLEVDFEYDVEAYERTLQPHSEGLPVPWLILLGSIVLMVLVVFSLLIILATI